jgi:hypothetical protein
MRADNAMRDPGGDTPANRFSITSVFGASACPVAGSINATATAIERRVLIAMVLPVPVRPQGPGMLAFVGGSAQGVRVCHCWLRRLTGCDHSHAMAEKGQEGAPFPPALQTGMKQSRQE